MFGPYPYSDPNLLPSAHRMTSCERRCDGCCTAAYHWALDDASAPSSQNAVACKLLVAGLGFLGVVAALGLLMLLAPDADTAPGIVASSGSTTQL